ncbi:MAG: O-antigen ligase family protein [Actinomycetota bacterium]
MALLLAGYPVAWALGLGLVHHAALAGAMLLWLLVNRPLRVAPGTGPLALFVLVVALSGIGLDSAGAGALFLLRLSWYVAALVCWLHLTRLRNVLAGRRVVRSLVLLWVLVVIGGWLSVLAPDLEWSTPLARILPAALTDNELIARFLGPSVSETQVFRSDNLTLNRPAAPFAYTNGWGSAMALLTPFALAAVHDRRLGIRRPLMVIGLALALVPFTQALNRGSWLTLGIGLAYGAVRWARLRRDPRPLAVLGLVVAVGLAVASLTGVAQSAAESLATRSADSNETRAGLYLETIEETASSPLIGYGSTRPSTDNPDGPPLGTHGQLWAVLFAHGFVGLALYLGFFVAALLRARAETPVQHWAKVSLLIGLVQLPIYGHLPHQLFIMVAAAAILSWPTVIDRLGPDRPERHAGR